MKNVGVFVSSVLIFLLPCGLLAITCDPGWKPYMDSCYYFSSRLLDWQTSYDYCATRGAMLCEVDGKGEDVFLFRELDILRGTQHATYAYWVGGTDVEVEGEWYWATSFKPFNFTHWTHGHPDNAGNEDCATLSNYDDVWNDLSCTKQAYFICEKPLHF